MTYVTEQTSQELRAHMRRLKAMAGWHEPLADRLYKEVLELDARLEAKVAQAVPTGWPPGMLQDDSRGLSKWLAGKPDALQHVKAQAMSTDDKDAEIAALRKDYEQACKLVAQMHEAAMGCITGPVVGVVEDVAALRRDAERYRWLRTQHWQKNTLAVVLRPKDNTRLGCFLPFDELLDSTIDAAMIEGSK